MNIGTLDITREVRVHRRRLPIIALLVGALSAVPAGTGVAQPIDSSLSPDRVRQLAEEAGIFGFPLVENYRLIRQRCAKESPAYTPFNTFLHMKDLRGSSTDLVSSFGADSYFSIAVLDLRTGPVVLSVPKVSDRYYSIQFIDIPSENFAYVGTRNIADNAGGFLVVGPGWKGRLPFPGEFTQIIPSPSWLVLLIGRTELQDVADSTKVEAIQKGIRAQPLRSYYGGTTSPGPPLDWPPDADARTCSAPEFFTVLNFMMQWQAFLPKEFPFLQEISSIGIVPGMSFEGAGVSAAHMQALEEGLGAARRRIASAVDSIAVNRNGWLRPPMKREQSARDYLVRAAESATLLYSDSAEEMMYFVALEDSSGGPLDGATGCYTLRFAKDPPAEYVWSLAVLDARTLKVEGTGLRRVLMGKKGKKNSIEEGKPLTVLVQRENPGSGKDATWLPVPDGPFLLLLRLYGPVSGSAPLNYKPPSVIGAPVAKAG